MTASEKRDAAHARMRQQYDAAFFALWKQRGYNAHADSFRAGFLTALRYATDEMPRVLRDDELEQVRSA